MAGKGTKVATLVHSMADRKRQDLEFLRAFLVREGEGEQQQAEKNQNGATISGRSSLKVRSDDSTARWNLCRRLAVDLPLVMLFASLAMVYVMRCVFEDYYVKIMARARRTDQDLLDEYTYYERQCTAEDITHGFSVSTANTTTEEAMDSLLMHGACIIPGLISEGTVSNLRRYLQQRNKVISEDEKYPMSQGYRRLSYGLEPTDDEAIVQAISEITSNTILPELLKETLGMEDPALSEITTITSFFGAEDQVIHSDTKSDGYAAQFARTYSHSYSLFIPVQPITTEMGVTQLCPGTHYCTNDMQDVCEQEMFGINEAYGDKKVWPAGDGALINQQVWHGGSRHNDPQGPERILFILSFIARPQLGKDTRQLARGTYFHMKWSMWGHCLFDMKDSAQSTKWPFNIFRALALWKPRRRHWGYDLLMSAALRATNRQSGMEAEDLETFIDLKMTNLFHFPKWLQGGLLSYNEEGEESIWQVYIQETLDNTLVFLQFANGLLLVLYFIIVVITGSGGGKAQFFRLRSVFGHLAVAYVFVASLAWITLLRIRSSDWGTNIASGVTFMKPFPLDSDFTSARWENDPTIPQGISTLPERNDVLFGTRYDASWLGSYNQWLNYHPGNIQFEMAIAEQAPFYPIVKAAGHPILLQNLIRYVVDEVAEATQGGRYLAQDHFSGDWVALERSDVEEMVRTSLAVASNPILKEIDKCLKYLVADYRFGTLRGTALAYESSLYLYLLRKQLLRFTPPVHQISSDASKRPRLSHRSGYFLPLCRKSQLQKPQPTVPRVLSRLPRVPRVPRNSTVSSQYNEEPKVGTPCMVYHSLDRTWTKGTVVFCSGDGYFDIKYANGRIEENVSIRRLRRAVHVQEGTHVRVKLDDAVMHGVLSLVSNGRADIILEDGELISEVVSDAYDIQWPMF